MHITPGGDGTVHVLDISLQLKITEVVFKVPEPTGYHQSVVRICKATAVRNAQDGPPVHPRPVGCVW